MKLFSYNCKKGFTLAEILVAVMIMIILVTMAVPMYDRVIEKSRISEVSLGLKRLSDAKLRTMEMRGQSNYAPGDFGMLQVDATMPGTEAVGATQQDITASCTEHFYYSLYPNATFSKSVCATRKKGDHAGTTFLYIGEEGEDYCSCSSGQEGTITVMTGPLLCSEYCAGTHLFCQGNPGDCEAYGMASSDVTQIDCDTSDILASCNN